MYNYTNKQTKCALPQRNILHSGTKSSSPSPDPEPI